MESDEQIILKKKVSRPANKCIMLKFCRPGNFTYKQIAILFAKKKNKFYQGKAIENLYRLKKHPKKHFSY